MIVNVCWVSYHKPEIVSRGCWHSGLLEGIFDRSHWRPPSAVEFVYHDGFENLPVDATGAIVILGAQHHANQTDYDRLNLDLARLDWCILMLVGDEESLFDHPAIEHPAMRLWVQTPRPGKHDDIAPDHFLPFGYHPDTPRILATFDDEKNLPWFFAGQVTHSRRRECVAALHKLNQTLPGNLVPTAGFAQGMVRQNYLNWMARAKVIPCPSGPASVDTFRVWEALESGCVPILDGRIPGGADGSIDMASVWDMIAPYSPRITATEWTNVGTGIDFLLNGTRSWESWAADWSSWWQQRKRAISLQIERDISDLELGRVGRFSLSSEAADLITIILPTSPIPSHPSTAIIETTVDSIRAQPALADAEILILCDGVRPEQEDRRGDYAEYLRKLCWLTEHRWQNVVPFISGQHVHQGGLMRTYLSEVNTPLVLFVEHDTPVDGAVPWQKMGEVILSGQANVVRLMHEALILEPHKHMMLDPEPIDFDGLPVIRTSQWSQRPHLAKTSYYRHLINTYFGAESDTYVEDCIHGVLSYAFRTYGEAGWDQHRVVIYAPEGDMKRSLDLDGRGTDEKYPPRFEYDGPTPEGAPRAMSERVD